MDYLISVSFGELTLKGDNRKDFENRIIRKIKKAIADFEVEELLSQLSKINLDINFYDKKILRKISKEDFDKLFFKE